MKNILSISVLFSLVLALASCSVTFEKRKYRPGYHVEFVNNTKNDRKNVRQSPTIIKNNELKTVSSVDGNNRPLIQIVECNIPMNHVRDQNFFTCKNDTVLKKHVVKPNQDKSWINQVNINKDRKGFTHSHLKAPKDPSSLHDIKLKQDRLIAAILLLVVAILFTVLAFFCFTYNISLLLGAISALFAAAAFIVALCLFFTKTKHEIQELQEKNPNLRNERSVRGALVVSILGIVLGLTSFATAFIDYFGFYLGITLGPVGLILSIISLIMSAVALKKESNSKTIWALVLSILGVILSILGIILGVLLI